MKERGGGGKGRGLRAQGEEETGPSGTAGPRAGGGGARMGRDRDELVGRSATAAAGRGCTGGGGIKGRGRHHWGGKGRERAPCIDGKKEKLHNPRCNNGVGLIGEDDLAGTEHKLTDSQRFGGPIVEPNAPRRSPQRDERSGTLGFRRRCTDWK
jgi:hypothetical protein